MNYSPPPLYTLPKSKNETLSLIHGIYAGLLFCALAIVWYLEYQQKTMAEMQLWGLSAIMLLMFGLNILACIRVKKGNNQGKILSRVMAVLMLPSFPIGTLLGLFSLWKTTKTQWE
ncbi:hypothetical protein BEN71_06235 [Acinetobacter wuhouensis]|uniref:hypothetical protein n=1 Tax=Acinetobacter TaxID=469 RepID=UPI00083B9B07|nr:MULTISPECIES: hypothetical protein [Acinetobacter]AXQ21685.1 hypothetical protein BEN71_06235 [Acinetobacter wuhouensis]RZG76275.1 hypothetical protein EXE09_08475 [Acinetobacter sp. WCHAc060025]